MKSKFRIRGQWPVPAQPRSWKRGLSWGKVLRGIAILLGSLFFISLVITTIQVGWLRGHNPSSTSWMRMRMSEALQSGKQLKIKHKYISINQIPRSVKRAVIAAEDAKFYEHHGFDWEAISKAHKSNEKSGKIKRGGSTITQQLAKNIYLSPKRSYVRKVREGIITVVMEWLLPKERILELYLNCIEFGPGVFGIEEAARYHFKTSAKYLTTDQACRLAAIIPSPIRYKVNGDYVKRRASRIARMLK